MNQLVHQEIKEKERRFSGEAQRLLLTLDPRPATLDLFT
jgi:hypothetical protein